MVTWISINNVFFVQNSIHIEEASITRLSNLCQTEPINYTVCSVLRYVFVGDIPLHIDIRETADSGKPIVVSQPDCLQVECTTHDIVLKQHQANLTWTLKKETRLKKHRIKET